MLAVGRRIGSYGRKLIVPDAKGKGKQAVNGDDSEEPHWEECDPEEEGAVVYEAWAVSFKLIPQTTSLTLKPG
jgi:hypothetical protein